MAVRRKSSQAAPSDAATQARGNISAVPDDLPSLAPPKLAVVLSLSVAFYTPFFYLVYFVYDIESELRKSITINAAMSFGGFLVALQSIPVAARYLLKRSLFGYDINKKGTPQGNIKV